MGLKHVIKQSLLQATATELLGYKATPSFSSAMHIPTLKFCFQFTLFSHWFINCQIVCLTSPYFSSFPEPLSLPALAHLCKDLLLSLWNLLLGMGGRADCRDDATSYICLCPSSGWVIIFCTKSDRRVFLLLNGKNHFASTRNTEIPRVYLCCN